METTVGFLESGPGIKSSERLKSLVIVLATLAFIFGYCIWLQKEPTTEFNFLVLIMLMAGVTPTGLKKIAEIRAGKMPSKEKVVVEKTSSES